MKKDKERNKKVAIRYEIIHVLYILKMDFECFIIILHVLLAAFVRLRPLEIYESLFKCT